MQGLGEKTELSSLSCLILAGPVGSGKTTALTCLLDRLAASGSRVTAILQPDTGRRPDGGALGFTMELYSSDGGRARRETLPLARALEPGEDSSGLTLHGRFAFSTGSFARAARFFEARLADGRTAEGVSSASVVGLDEIGRLELSGGEGLKPCLDLSLAAGGSPGGPMLLVLAARDSVAHELEGYLRSRGCSAESVSPPDAAKAFEVASRTLKL